MARGCCLLGAVSSYGQGLARRASWAGLAVRAGHVARLGRATRRPRPPAGAPLPPTGRPALPAPPRTHNGGMRRSAVMHCALVLDDDVARGSCTSVSDTPCGTPAYLRHWFRGCLTPGKCLARIAVITTAHPNARPKTRTRDIASPRL